MLHDWPEPIPRRNLASAMIEFADLMTALERFPDVPEVLAYWRGRDPVDVKGRMCCIGQVLKAAAYRDFCPGDFFVLAFDQWWNDDVPRHKEFTEWLDKFVGWRPGPTEQEFMELWNRNTAARQVFRDLSRRVLN
jgi:hypothetical protein